ncbi:M48 family metallopeptidase [Halomonas almeriensis]|uniref:M48 family metallopeptidase n=1 Tax=Halomonas almeriensis TaxID=308163 RepID=UPI0025B54F4E|nr:M48 family metallopeptidase [Halomonas almeriensis]MDN3551946.1 M48 family metallopeptidase [Halomonas almeriensis]
MRWMQCLAIGALSIAIAACSTSPTGRSQLMLMSESELNRMGAKAFDKYQQELPTVGGAPLRRVQCITNAIVKVLPPEERQSNWEVRVFKDESANAFALPGGYVGVNTGLLDLADDTNQVASVIGHEIAHVMAQHANERASTQSATQVGLSVASAAAAAAGLEGPTHDMTMQALGMGAQFGVQLPFSRSHESEADEIGLDLMARAGFDPRASVQLWRNMSQAGGGQPPEWMSTHPSHGSRISDLQAGMNQAMTTYRQARQSGRTPDC